MKYKAILLTSSILCIILLMGAFMGTEKPTASISSGSGIIFDLQTGTDELFFNETNAPRGTQSIPAYKFPNDYNPTDPNDNFTDFNGWGYFTDEVGGNYVDDPAEMTPGEVRHYGPDDDDDGGFSYPTAESPNDDPSIGVEYDGDNTYVTARPTTQHTVKIGLHPDLSNSHGETGNLGTAFRTLPAGTSFTLFICPSDPVTGKPDVSQRRVLFDHEDIDGDIDKSYDKIELTVNNESPWPDLSEDEISHCNWIIWEFDMPGHPVINEFAIFPQFVLFCFPIMITIFFNKLRLK